MNKVLSLLLAAGFIFGSYATDARVVVMGRSDAFYRDEVSVFKNPADISLYPNLVYGSYGVYFPQPSQSEDAMAALRRTNTDPKDPFFGAFVSHNLTQEENGSKVSFGAVFNRRDPLLSLLQSKDTGLVEPVGKIDLVLGYDLGNGISLGLGGYGATQRVVDNDEVVDETSIYKATAGLNWDLGQGLDFEASANAGKLRAKDSATVVSDGDYFFRGNLRFLSEVPSINGAFVPQASLQFVNIGEESIMDVAGGIGLNINIDRGFFFTGLEGLYSQEDDTDADESVQSIGTRVSFGIERNIIWDWFLIRVGGQKEIRYQTDGPNSGMWVENVAADGSDGDLVGLGFGINIDNKFRADFVAAEDIAYTFTNLISGPQHRLFSRVSATYNF
ncbi:MAG: hypothetical protein ACLFQB_08120 [Chitinispirillaceae bacterium]